MNMRKNAYSTSTYQIPAMYLLITTVWCNFNKRHGNSWCAILLYEVPFYRYYMFVYFHSNFIDISIDWWFRNLLNNGIFILQSFLNKCFLNNKPLIEHSEISIAKSKNSTGGQYLLIQAQCKANAHNQRWFNACNYIQGHKHRKLQLL